MTKSKTKEVAVKENTSLATYDYGEDANVGVTVESIDELSTPFLGLLQALSPAVKDRLIDGAESGDFLDSITQELFKGEEGLILQVAEIQREFVEWIPRKQGGGFVGRHTPDSQTVADAKKHAEQEGLPYGTLKTGENFVNDLVETYYVYANILDETGENMETFVVIPFKSTMIKAIADFRTAINRLPINAPIWAYRVVLKSKKVEKNGESWHAPTITAFNGGYKASLIDPKGALYEAGKAYNGQVTAGEIELDMSKEGGATEATTSSGSGDEDIPF